MPNWKKVILSGSNAHINNLTASGHFSALDNGFTVNNSNSTELFVDGNIIATGDITGENYIVSSTIMHMTQSFSDGSTIFGDTLNDTHRFTGSLFITGITFDSTPVGDGVVVVDTANGRLYYTGSYGGAGGSGTGFPFTGSAGVSGSIIIDGDINVGGGVFTSASLASAVAGDNLGNHTATTTLDLASNNIDQVGIITANQYNVANDIRDNGDGEARIEFATNVIDVTFNNEADQNINMTPKTTRFAQPVTASAPISASAGNYIFGPQLLGSNGFQQSAPYDSTGSIIAYGQGRDNVILQVNDNTKEHGIAFRNSGGAYTNVIYRTQASNPTNIADLRIAGGTNNSDPTALTDLLTISASGNVGIGLVQPNEKLTVNGNISASGNLFASLSLDSSNLKTVMYNTVTGQFFHTGSYGGGGGGGGSTPGGSAGSIQYNDGSNGFAGETAFNYIEGTNTVELKNNAGTKTIGLAFPNNGPSLYTDNVDFYLAERSSPTTIFGVFDKINKYLCLQPKAVNLQPTTPNTAHIGTARLHVLDNPNNASGVVTKIINQNPIGRYNLLIGTRANSNTFQGIHKFISFHVGCTNDAGQELNGGILYDPQSTFGIPQSANTLLFQGVFIQSSDKKLKKHITFTKKSIDDIMSIKVKDFRWKEQPKNTPKNTGFIAQDLLETHPEMVRNIDGTLNIEYDKIIPLLVKAVQDQQHQINNLKEQLKNK